MLQPLWMFELRGKQLSCIPMQFICHLASYIVCVFLTSHFLTYRSFIRADVIAYEDYAANGGDKLRIRMAGKLKSETRKYVVNDGDIVEFFSHEVTSSDSGLTIASGSLA